MKKLALVGITALVGCQTYQEDFSYQWNSVQFNKTETIEADGNTHVQEGTGFVFGDKYITLDHVVNLNELRIPTPWGIITRTIEKKQETTYVDKIPLEKIESSDQTDVAVFKLPYELCVKYCNEGMPVNTSPKLGEEIYWVGHPGLSGKTLRFGRISRLDNPSDEPKYEGSFGLSTYCVGGDSGSPAFNSRAELIGVVQGGHSQVCYVKPIKAFLDVIVQEAKR